MIPAKIEPTLFTPIRETGVESIADWFEQHKQSFYILGLTYLPNQQQVEDLFYRSILKVHKELRRHNRDASFETRVLSIFIQTCRELSEGTALQGPQGNELRGAFFNALDRLKKDEREALALTYIKEVSREDASHLLGVPVEKINVLLFSGIQSLKNALGYGQSMNGCKQHYEKYIDYLEGTMPRPEKIDLEIHIYHCPDCQEDLAAFQDVMLTVKSFAEGIKDFQVPANFILNVKAKLAERDKHRQEKIRKRKRIGFVLAGILALLIGIEVFTGSFSNVYYAYAEENPELRGFLRHGFGEVLNLEAESDGVKVRIKSVIADDVQTLVFYEVEDTDEDSQYMIDIHQGVSVENQQAILNHDAFQRYSLPDLEAAKTSNKKNVYRGKFSLLPLKEQNGTIKLKVTKLRKFSDFSVQDAFVAYDNMEYETGVWNFEIPVTKQPSVEYALDGKTEIEGIPVRFEKLTIAPTATVLDYAIAKGQPEKRIEFLSFDNLVVNNKKAKAETYGNNYVSENVDWATFQAYFDPHFVGKPKDVSVQFNSVFLAIEDEKTIMLDATQSYPQTFEYAGSTISIDKFEIGTPTTIVISNHEIKNRAYGSLWLDIAGDYETGTVPMDMNPEGVIVDKNGKVYNFNEITNYEKIEQPRQFITVQNIRLHNNNSEESVVPNRIELRGYNITKYLDEVVEIAVE